jgi:hypothetical protein
MGDVDSVSKLWARQAMKNARFLNLLKTRYDSLLIQSLSDGGLDKVTSATKNGVSMGKQVGLSVPDVMEAMEKALAYVELGQIPQTTRTLGRFTHGRWF